MTQPYHAPQHTTALTLRGVARHFGNTQVLKQLDLDITEGEIVAIIGRSGCGKSTLLRLLAGLDHADDGTLEWHGAPLARHTHDIRLMFQEPRLLPWKSVLDNAALGSNHMVAHQALEEVGLSEHQQRWPAQLSGGQRSRVALARALAHQPQLLLLDEPLGALDALTRSSMHQLIERLWREHGFTLVLVTHDVAEAVTLADRVILLDEGRVALDLRIDVPRPRRATDPQVIRHEETLLAHLTGQHHSADSDRSTHGGSDDAPHDHYLRQARVVQVSPDAIAI